jgi:BirA family biotin operon repressor/biotin-[acetyl-CoA-carboxylase] ligase
MKVYTDSTKFADMMVFGACWRQSSAAAVTPEMRQLHSEVFAERTVFEAEVQGVQRWQYLLVSENSHRSQYDLLIEQRRLGHHIPDGVLCLSGAGSGLHGLRQRPWAAEAGNIHLSVHLRPEKLVVDSGIPFMVLAAVSVIDAIDSVPGLETRAGVKWVNDILLEGAKVAGVLAYTEGAGKSIDAAVLGIGLNVETTPAIEGTPFVPKVGSVRDFVSDPDSCRQGTVFEALLGALDLNYRMLQDGQKSELIDRYRERSVVVGKEVRVCVDDASSPSKTIAEGKVQNIGDNLELYLAGRDAPVTRGRLILESEN